MGRGPALKLCQKKPHNTHSFPAAPGLELCPKMKFLRAQPMGRTEEKLPPPPQHRDPSTQLSVQHKEIHEHVKKEKPDWNTKLHQGQPLLKWPWEQDGLGMFPPPVPSLARVPLTHPKAGGDDSTLLHHPVLPQLFI